MDGKNINLVSISTLGHQPKKKKKEHNLICVLFWKSVFNVTDQDGNKVTDEGVLDYIQKVCDLLFGFDFLFFSFACLTWK